MAEPRLDVVTIGRAAVDLYGEQIGGRLEDMASFAKYLGGSPANIAVGAARLGLRVGMITRVGDEHMGRFVREALAAEGIDTSQVRTDPARLTGLVILGIRDRETFPLIFYRENCADMALAETDIDGAFIAASRAVVVTGTHFSTPGTDRACRRAMHFAREAGAKVALDIDYRPVLWGLTGRGLGEQRFVAADSVSAHLQTIVPACDLIVGTEEEIHIAGGTTDTRAALARLRASSQAVIVMKRGASGCVVFTGAIPEAIDDGLVVAGFPVEVFNVLGAGDAFMAGLLHGWLTGASWRHAATMANACGALVVSRHGCAPAMASRAELDDFLARDDRPRRLSEDRRTQRLHRATTGRSRPNPVPAIELGTGMPPDLPGLGLVWTGGDEELLHRLTGRGLWIARNLALDPRRDPAVTLRSWPADHVVLARIGVPDDALFRLFAAVEASGHALVLAPDSVDRVAMVYDLGVTPEWWLLPAGLNRPARRAAIAVMRERDALCAGALATITQQEEIDDVANDKSLRGFIAAAALASRIDAMLRIWRRAREGAP